MRWNRLFNVEQLWDKAQRYFLIPLTMVSLLFLIAWAVDPVREWLQRHGFSHLDVTWIVANVLALATLVLVALESRLKRIGRQIEHFSPPGTSTIVEGGVGNIYPELRRMLNESQGLGAKTLDVLGLMLFTAWPNLIEPCIRDETLRKWRVNLYHLAPEFIANNPYIPPAWAANLAAKLADIQAFEKNELAKYDTTLSLIAYRFFPAIHGFRTNAGHLAISYIHWSDKRLDGPFQFYEVFEPTDKSLRAERYRALFDNWVTRAAK